MASFTIVTALINVMSSCRHNEDMEKKMVQKHKEQRNKGGEKENKLKKCFRDKVLQVIVVVSEDFGCMVSNVM
jgi:hypothetical protein